MVTTQNTSFKSDMDDDDNNEDENGYYRDPQRGQKDGFGTYSPVTSLDREIDIDCDDDADLEVLLAPRGSPWWEYLRTVVTAEPITVCFFLAMGLTDPAIKALAYHKVCLQEYDTKICDNLHNESFKQQEDKVQSITSHWFLYAHLAYEIPSVVFTFLCGAVGDHYSRRLALALPCVGQILSFINLMFLSIYMNSHVSLILISMISNGIFGGTIAARTGVFSMIGEVSSTENRTFRISIAQGVEALSTALAYFISGFIADNTNYATVFIMAAMLSTLGFIYCFTWLKVPERQDTQSGKLKEAVHQACSTDGIKHSMLCLVKKRENRGRLRLITIMISIFFGMVSHNCESS